MKPKEYIALITDDNGFIPTPYLRRIPRKNLRQTAREEAIAAKVIEEANPRENITGHYPWGPEESLILQQFWMDPKRPHIGPKHPDSEWRDVPTLDAHLYSTTDTKYGPLPVPEAIKQPGTIVGDLREKVREAIGE